jgi:hypothetical protein
MLNVDLPDSGKRVHGWDHVHGSAASFSGDKGGSLWGAGTDVYFTTGGMSYLYFSGTNAPWAGASVADWHGPLMDAVAGYGPPRFAPPGQAGGG